MSSAAGPAKISAAVTVRRYPIFLTMCHMLSCTFMGYAFSKFSSTPAKSVRGGVVLTKIAVLATVFCLSVVLGNASLRFIPVSFNQARASAATCSVQEHAGGMPADPTPCPSAALSAPSCRCDYDAVPALMSTKPQKVASSSCAALTQ